MCAFCMRINSEEISILIEKTSSMKGMKKGLLIVAAVCASGVLGCYLGWSFEGARFATESFVDDVTTDLVLGINPEVEEGLGASNAPGGDSEIDYFNYLSKWKEDLSEGSVGAHLAGIAMMDSQEAGFMLRVCAYSDPAGFLKYFEENKTGVYDLDPMLHIALYSLGMSSPEKAIEWIRYSSDSILEQENRMRSIFNGWMESDIEGAARYVSDQMEDNEARLRYVKALASRYSEVLEAGEFLSWAEGMKGDRGRRLALADVGARIIEANPVEALRLFGERLEGESSSGMLFVNAAMKAGEVDPEAALDEILAYSDDGVRRNALTGLFFRWGEIDLAGVEERIRKIPSGPSKDLAVMTVLPRLVSKDVEYAFGWAEAISDDVIRDEAMNFVLENAEDRLN